MEYKFANVKGSVIVPTSLETNVIELHKYLYGEDVAYTPSATVKERSEKILEIVGGEANIVDTAPVVEAVSYTHLANSARAIKKMPFKPVTGDEPL